MDYQSTENNVLNLSNQSLRTISKSILKNLNLIELDLSNNELTELPEFISKLKYLKILKLRNNKFKIAPELIHQFKYLKVLSLSENEITVIPQSFSKLSKLEKFDIGSNPLVEFPKWINKLYVLKDLGIYDLKLTLLPDIVTQIRSLEILSLDGNDLITLPDSIDNLKNLKELWVEANQFEYIPESIGNLTNLERINFGINKIECLPESICNLWKLESLSVSENNIKELPNNIGKLSRLKNLNISYNQITTLPKSFSRLNIRNLEVWFEGNFYTEKAKKEIKILFPDIEDSELELESSSTEEKEILTSKKLETSSIEISKSNEGCGFSPLLGVLILVLLVVFFTRDNEDPIAKANKKANKENSVASKFYKRKCNRIYKSNQYLYVYTNDTSELKAYIHPNIDFHTNPYAPDFVNTESETEALIEFLNDNSLGFDVVLDNNRIRLIQSIILDSSFVKESVKKYSLVVDYKMTKKQIEIKKRSNRFKSIYERDNDTVFNSEKMIYTSKELEDKKEMTGLKYFLSPIIDLDNREYHFYFSPYNNNYTKLEFIKAVEDFKIMFLKENANKNIGVIRELKIESPEL